MALVKPVRIYTAYRLLVIGCILGTPLGRIIGNGAGFTGKAYGVTRVAVVKNQAIPAYDPRAVKGVGVTYATTTMGADHTAGYAVATNILKVGGFVSPLEKEGNIDLSRNLQIATAALDSTGLCLFVAFSILDNPDAFQAIVDGIFNKKGATTLEVAHWMLDVCFVTIICKEWCQWIISLILLQISLTGFSEMPASEDNS